MRYERTITVPKNKANQIMRYTDIEPSNKDECLGEDDTITYTAKFDDGYEMDIKCCGVQYEEGGVNTAWTEAVLFKNGSEVCCSEPSEGFFGEWTLETNGDEYVVNVEIGKDT